MTDQVDRLNISVKVVLHRERLRAQALALTSAGDIALLLTCFRPDASAIAKAQLYEYLGFQCPVQASGTNLGSPRRCCENAVGDGWLMILLRSVPSRPSVHW